MVSPTATVQVKLSDDLKSLCDRLPENMSERLAEIERVLIEICDRNGIAFNLDRPSLLERALERERVLRNVKGKGTE